MNYYLINKTGAPISLHVKHGERTHRTYSIPNETPVRIEEAMVWNQSHFHLYQSTEDQAYVFYEMVGFFIFDLRYNTPYTNGNRELGRSKDHKSNEIIVQSLAGGGHILVGEIGIIGEGEEDEA